MTSADGIDETPDEPGNEPKVEVLSVHPFPVVLTGTALFALAFLGMLPFWGWLGDHGHRDWLWTALTGTILGCMALPLMRKHRGEGRIV